MGLLDCSVTVQQEVHLQDAYMRSGLPQFIDSGGLNTSVQFVGVVFFFVFFNVLKENCNHVLFSVYFTIVCHFALAFHV